MKYKHYAPKADVTLLDGTFEQFKAYVDAHADQNPSCLCFTGEAEKLGVPCVEYGREGDGADQAKHIFRCLRALDEQGDAVVYARCPQKRRPFHGGVQPPDPRCGFPGDRAMIVFGDHWPQRLRKILRSRRCFRPTVCRWPTPTRSAAKFCCPARRCCPSWRSGSAQTF